VGDYEAPQGDRWFFDVPSRIEPLFTPSPRPASSPARQLNEVPWTIFDKPDKSSFYDQIAWFTDEQKGPVLSLRCEGGGSFDFVKRVARRSQPAGTVLSHLRPLPPLG
jgi:hypothetical protein